MGDVPYPPEPEPTKVDVLGTRVDEAVRAALTGDPSGRIRRAVLFVLVALGIALNVPALALVALLVLALSDQVVPL